MYLRNIIELSLLSANPRATLSLRLPRSPYYCRWIWADFVRNFWWSNIRNPACQRWIVNKNKTVRSHCIILSLSFPVRFQYLFAKYPSAWHCVSQGIMAVMTRRHFNGWIGGVVHLKTIEMVKIQLTLMVSQTRSARSPCC